MSFTQTVTETLAAGVVRARGAAEQPPVLRLRVNDNRLNATIHDTAQWGSALRYGPGETETGMARLALDDNDALVRRWFVQEMEALGCKVIVDEMGNLFAIRAGEKDGPPTACGSHLDTQPTGGRYDGILGVLAGVEAMRTIVENNIKTKYPICVINWTNEEGARFPKSIVSSSVWSGDLSLAKAHALADLKDPSATMLSELKRIGFHGTVRCSHEVIPLAAHFELHIEQGPVLEAKSKKVGVVLGGQAYRWYTITVDGRDCHTGSTPFANRSDAMLCAAKIIVSSNTIAKKLGGLASTGVLSLLPGSTNVCPGMVKFSLDVRAASTDLMVEICESIEKESYRIGKEESERGCKVTWEVDTHSDAPRFHPAAIDAVRQAAIKTVGADMVEELYSGAGHDSFPVSKHCPTAMIFVPSKEGISHNPVEYTSPEECAIGAQVLLSTLLGYDASRD